MNVVIRYNPQYVSGFVEFVIEDVGTSETRLLQAQLVCTSEAESPKSYSHRFERDRNAVPSLIFDTYCLDDGLWDLALQIENEAFLFQVHVVNGNSQQATKLRSETHRLTAKPLFTGPIDSKVFNFFENGEFSHHHLTPESPTWSQLRIDFESNGFVILRGLLSKQVCAAASAACDQIKADGLFGYISGSSDRIVSAHTSVNEFLSIYEASEIRDAVFELLGEPSYPAQSLTFINGSEQAAHADWIHLSTYPLNSMCGVWVALEDVKPSSGELFYFPGSHLGPRIAMSDLELPKISTENPDWNEFGLRYSRAVAGQVSSQSLTSESFTPSAGDVLIWHENLIHGGNKRLNMELSRRSIVMHFFKQSCYAWYDTTGIVANKDFVRIESSSGGTDASVTKTTTH